MTTVPDSETGRINAAFNEAAGRWDQDRNIFYRLHDFTDAEFRKLARDPSVVAEFRQLMGKGTSPAKALVAVSEHKPVHHRHHTVNT